MSTNPSAASEDAIAEYIKKKYRAQHEAAQTQGLSAYLKDPPVRGRVNQRFLSNTLRAVAFENRQADRRDRDQQERSCSRSRSPPEHAAHRRHEYRSYSASPRPRNGRNAEAHTLRGGTRPSPPRSQCNPSEQQGHRTSPSHRRSSEKRGSRTSPAKRTYYRHTPEQNARNCSPSYRRHNPESRSHSTRRPSSSPSHGRHTRYRPDKSTRSPSPSNRRNRRHSPDKRSHSQSKSCSAEAHRCPAGGGSESRSSSEYKRRSPSPDQHDTASRCLKRKALSPFSSCKERMQSPRVPSTTDTARGSQSATRHKDKPLEEAGNSEQWEFDEELQRSLQKVPRRGRGAVGSRVFDSGPFQEDDAADTQLHMSSSVGGYRKPQNVLLPAEDSHGGRPIGSGLQGSSAWAGLAGSMHATTKGRGTVNVNERVVQLAKQLMDSGVPLEVATARAETQVLTDVKAEGKGSKKRSKKDKKHKDKKHKKEKRSHS